MQETVQEHPRVARLVRPTDALYKKALKTPHVARPIGFPAHCGRRKTKPTTPLGVGVSVATDRPSSDHRSGEEVRGMRPPRFITVGVSFSLAVDGLTNSSHQRVSFSLVSTCPRARGFALSIWPFFLMARRRLVLKCTGKQSASPRTWRAR